MRLARVPVALVPVLLAASGLAVVAAPPAVSDIIPSTPIGDCSPGGPRPCVISFTRNGGPATGFGYTANTFELSGSREVTFTVDKAGDFELGAAALGDTFSISLDMGSIVPRVVTGHGRDATVTRSRAGTHRVTLTAHPVVISGQCDQSASPWRCPEADVVVNDPGDFNNREWDGYLDVQVSDYGVYDDATLRNTLYGLDYFTNVAATSSTPSILHDGATGAYYLQLELANRRYRDDGETLVQGRAEMRIPNAFLRSAYGVPDPELMTGSSLTVTGPGTTASTTVTQESGDDAMRVLVDGMEFPDIHVADGELRHQGTAQRRAASMRTVKVRRGVIAPTRPTLTRAVRTGSTTARLTFGGAKARGARITGFQARCVARGSTVVRSGGSPAISVKGLKPGRAYRCTVRARSKGGSSLWSASRLVPSRP